MKIGSTFAFRLMNILNAELLPLLSDVDLEVLRRDVCCNLDREEFSEMRGGGRPREESNLHISQTDNKPGEPSGRRITGTNTWRTQI